MTNPQEEFQKNLAAMDPAQQAQMMKLITVIAQPPETMMALFDRLGMKWKREYIGSEGEYPYGALIIDWREFGKAEKELQEQGPILKRLLAEDATTLGATPAQATQAYEQVRPPEVFEPKGKHYNNFQHPEA